MLRRHRLRLIRIGLTALGLALVGAALLPGAGGTAHAATATHKQAAKTPLTPAQLQAAAAAARKLADQQQLAAGKAEADLRNAELVVTTLQATNTLHPATPPAFGTAPDYAVQAAQTQLRQAQQNEQMAEMRAAPLQLPTLTPNASPGLTAALNTTSQFDVQNAQQAVITAQQALTAAQLNASQNTLSANIGSTADSAALHSAQLAVAAARRLALAADRAAQAAERNAQTLADEAAHARATAAN